MAEKKVGKFVELPKGLVDAFSAMCARHGTTFTFELVDAMRRHLAYPPERAPEPLPDSPAAPKGAKPKGGTT